MKHAKLMIAMVFSCQIAFSTFTVAQTQENAAQTDVFVAGVFPHERPAGAPVITQMPKDGAWYQDALFGVDPPYPASLRFLEDQGAWFNPFLHPGATGPYDIRNWHTVQ